MRKISIICAFFALSFFFLGIQLIIFKYVMRAGKGENANSQLIRGNISVISYENIKLFNTLCITHGLPVFIIDPPILQRVMSNITTKSSCKYLCNKSFITSFGILSQLWKKKAVIIDQFIRAGFKIAFAEERNPQLAISPNTTSMQDEYITTHYLLERKSHTIQLVFFYERTKSEIWWHGILFSKNSLVRGDIEIMDINRSHIVFGNNHGAYDKLETIKVTIDGINIRAPRYPTPFLQAIPNSDFIECNYKRAATFLNKYGRDTSSSAVAFRQSAIELIGQAKKTLDELGIPFWLSSGTCLGWFRQCDVIPYSKDVDFGVWIKDYDVRLIPAMQMSGMPIKHLFGKESDSYELSFFGGYIKLDIFFFYEDDNNVWNGGTQEKSGKKFKYTFPKFKLCWTEFLDMKVRVPCETTHYIEANYGTNWFEPVTEWDWKSSPPNVRENGFWPIDEWSRVIQNF